MNQDTEKLIKHGYLGPFPVPGLDLEKLSKAMELHMPNLAWPGKDYSMHLDSKPWFKSFHSLAPDFLDAARHPDILTVVHNIFPDLPVKLWGVAPLAKKAGAVHAWHSDIETRCWPTLTVWLGIKGVNKNTSLQVISHTHNLKATPDTLRKQGIPMHSNVEVLNAAKLIEPECELIIPDMQDGDCIIFVGSLWHGTYNTSSDIRYAATFQYSPADVNIRIPMNFEKPVQWHKQKPRCYEV